MDLKQIIFFGLIVAGVVAIVIRNWKGITAIFSRKK